MARKATKKTLPKSISTDPATKYAKQVLSGKIVAGPHVRNACQRFMDDLEHGHERGLHYDPDAAKNVYGFFEEILKLSEGQFENTPFILQPMQCFILGNLFGWKREDGRRRFRRAYIEAGKGCGKALAVDTPIPTPTGWTTMGTLRAGDEVLSDTGRPCVVIQAHPVAQDRKCYEIEFDDGEKVIASAEHLWRTERRRPKPGGTSIRTTAEIADTLRNANGKYQSANHSIPICAALELPDVELPIAPYVLGAWLGDGDSDCARITCAFADVQIIDEIQASGEPVRSQRRHSETTGRFSISAGRGKRGNTMPERLRSLGVLGNKHIPESYLRASKSQRLALLQGLMDTDGTISIGGRCEFTGVNEALARDVHELALSLGLKATFRVGVATLDGRKIGPKYRVFFSPPWDMPVFRLARKAARQVPTHGRRRLSADRRIVACRRVESVPVRCITVDSPSSMFLCGRSMVPTHNSPLAGGIGLYMMVADQEAGAQVYSAAAKRDQAAILFNDAVKMVRKSPALASRLQFSGGVGREFNIAYHKTASFFRPVSKDTGKSGSGPRPYCVLADEVHEMPDRSILETLERGFKFRRNPLLFMITNSGSDRNSVAWEEHEHAVRVAAGNREASVDPEYVGEIIDDSTFSYVCALDKDDDPLEDESCWEKVNPLLGVTITREYLREVVAQAKALPGKLNGILRLHFCVWTDAETAWMTRKTLEPVLHDFDPAEHKGAKIYLGLDLSQNRDITALGAVVETGRTNEGKPLFDAWAEAWTPGDTMAARQLSDKLPYDVWVNEGWLNAPPGESINFRHVAQRLAELCAEYDVQMVAYDRYAFKLFEREVEDLGLSVNFVEHPQGGTRRGKAFQKDLDGLWSPESVRQLEDAILEHRIRIQKNPVLISALMSSVAEYDRWDNHWLSKRRSVNKIDAAVAVMMAIGAATLAGQVTEPSYQMLIVG